MSEEGLNKLKRRRARERSNITRFANTINSSTEVISLDDYEHYKGRLTDALNTMLKLDDEIHELFSDDEYNDDVPLCEEYIDTAKRAIQRAAQELQEKGPATTVSLPDHTTIHTTAAPSVTTITHSVKLPPIKLEPFTGDVECWSRFWEQFESSVDNDPTLSTVNKHVFLRGYLEGEPKRLVDGIPVKGDTYEQTKRILQSRYGDKNRIIQAHLDFLENLQPTPNESAEALNVTYVECHRRIQALTALGEDVDAYGRMLTPKILRVFPNELCRRWITHAKRTNTAENSISKLMEFLNEEVEGAVIAQKIRGETSISSTPTLASFHVHSKPGKIASKTKVRPFCVFCERTGHWGQDCRTVSKVDERIEKLKGGNRCFLCLNRGHSARMCSKKGKTSCSNCKGSHHRSICRNSNETSNNTPQTTSVCKIGVTPQAFTYLQTARVRVIGPKGTSKLTRCVLDAGSQASFVTKSLIDNLQLETLANRCLDVTSFESSTSNSGSRRLVQLTLGGMWTNSNIPVTALESNHSFSLHPSVPYDIHLLQQTRKLQLADPKDESDNLPIEILIGADHYWNIVKDIAPIRISQSLVLLPSRLGWILSGNRSGITVNPVTVNCIDLNQTVLLQDDKFRKFWDLETLGISAEQPRPLSAKDSSILKDFHDSYQLEGGRRVVSLIRKEQLTLPDNRINAEKRFRSLEKRLDNDENLRNIYHEQMWDYVRRDQVEAEPFAEESKETFYLPHHLIRKEKRGNVKWRIVFDGSACERNMPSLNSTLEIGPNLLPEILSVLFRFRLYPMAIIGDATQAFLQLVLDRKDRDLTRFLWYRTAQMDDGSAVKNNDVITYRFKRLPFGLTCSPFLLCATLKELATLYKKEFPQAASLLDMNMYMDDFSGGGQNDAEVISVYYQIVSLMKRIQMPMTKWATNSRQLKYIWETEGQEVKRNAQLLGTDWDTESDSFLFNPQDIMKKLSNSPATKRQLLKAVATFYDPFGFLSPTSILAKILFQDTWSRGIGWDELLPHDIAMRWHRWRSTLPFLSDIQIPRHVDTLQEGTQIHVFCDASERAYGAVMYANVTIGETSTIRLLCSKSRLAPVKRVTLPRLELLAALVGARLLQYFCEATGFAIQNAVLWSDSMVTLGWLRGDPNKWKTFVCNRVTEILNYTTPSQWRHCPGEINPADSLSRGLPADELISRDIWWFGPEWLTQSEHQWPNDVAFTNHSLPERQKPKQHVLLVSIQVPLFQPTKYSSYFKVLNVTAWVMRFVHLLRGNTRSQKHLTAVEIQKAQTYWIRVVQLESFSEEMTCLEKEIPLPKTSRIACYHPFLQDGLIRLGGRLQYSNLSSNEKHPILLEGSHHFTKLLIRHTHVRLHHMGVRIVLMELREVFWIRRARQAIKKVLHECLPCKIARNKRGDNIEAPLPADRVQPLKPFEVSGVDFAGPLFIRSANTTKKAYIVLFTCAVTRAIHLELATNLSTDRFLMAFQRFVGRRGLPRTIYSDNAQSFKAASTELQGLHSMLEDPQTHQYLSHQNITWKFIPPRAAWWGGWWERMIGSVKRCMRKTLGKLQIDEEETNTLLISIEAALNSRPLTPADNDEILTPAHFLNGEKLTTIPFGQEEPTAAAVNHNLTKLYRHKQKITEDFWRRWTKDYLLELRSFHTVRTPRSKPTELKIGDIVLLQEDRVPRHMWKLARIAELKPGRDGKLRTVLLRTTQGSDVVRPIQLIVPLEIGTDQGGEDVMDCGQPKPFTLCATR